MKRDKALSILLRRAGQREGDTTLENQLIDEMQLLQENWERQGVPLPNGGTFWPRFLLGEVKETSTTTDDPRVQVPVDFLSEAEEGALFLYNTDGDKNWIPVLKKDWDTLRGEYSDSGQPIYYSLTGDYFYLFPVPDDNYTLKLLYYEAKSTLDSDIENAWLKNAPWLMIAGLGSVMAGEILHDDKLMQKFMDQFHRASLQLMNAEIGREETNREAIMGQSEYGSTAYYPHAEED